MITIDRLEKYLRSKSYTLEINSGVFQYWTSPIWLPVIVKLNTHNSEVWITENQEEVESDMKANKF